MNSENKINVPGPKGFVPRTEPVNRVKELVAMAFFVAFDILLGEILVPIKLPTLQISFGFISIMLAGMYLGPVRAATVGVVSDLLSSFMGIIGGNFFIGFTISALLNGLVAGYFLEGKKSSKVVNFVIWALISSLIISLGLTTVWLTIMGVSKKGFLPLLISRMPSNIGVLVAKIVTVPVIYNLVYKRLRLSGVETPGAR